MSDSLRAMLSLEKKAWERRNEDLSGYYDHHHFPRLLLFGHDMRMGGKRSKTAL